MLPHGMHPCAWEVQWNMQQLLNLYTQSMTWVLSGTLHMVPQTDARMTR